MDNHLRQPLCGIRAASVTLKVPKVGVQLRWVVPCILENLRCSSLTKLPELPEEEPDGRALEAEPAEKFDWFELIISVMTLLAISRNLSLNRFIHLHKDETTKMAKRKCTSLAAGPENLINLAQTNDSFQILQENLKSSFGSFSDIKFRPGILFIESTRTIFKIAA